MIHSGLEFADQMLEAAPGQARRRVIDIAANGRADDAEKLAVTRARLLSDGIVINGLAIEEDLKLLSNYFIQYVIGGPGAFVITANDFDDFGEAMERKLFREISSPQLSMRIEATSSHSYEAMNRQRSCKESVELPSRRGKQSSGQWQRSITPFREKATPRPA